MSKVFTFDNFYKHLNVIVSHEKQGKLVDGEWVYESDEHFHIGLIPIGKAEWEPEWEPNYDPEYGEIGRLYYEGEGEYTLVIWTKEPDSFEKTYGEATWMSENGKIGYDDVLKMYEQTDTECNFDDWVWEMDRMGVLTLIHP